MKQTIIEICNEIKELLLKKNESYGNAAAEPVNIFSSFSSIEAINIRIDDKLKRIKEGKEYENEDTELDLIGYLILKRCVREINKPVLICHSGVSEICANNTCFIYLDVSYLKPGDISEDGNLKIISRHSLRDKKELNQYCYVADFHQEVEYNGGTTFKGKNIPNE